MTALATIVAYTAVIVFETKGFSLTLAQKSVMDIGTQSSDYLLSKEAKSSTHMITSIPTTSAGYMSDGANKSLAVQAGFSSRIWGKMLKIEFFIITTYSNQFQKLTESAVNLSITSSSFVNLSSSTTLPATSSCFSTEAVMKQLPTGESFTKIPETVTLNEEHPGDVTFSFKNLDTPSTATNDVSSRGTAFCTVNTANTSDYFIAVHSEIIKEEQLFTIILPIE
uniref:Uncharacterized protein n=1 Tax=Wuchereria bancrofti TaxID=6293 RepID=A0AAF5PKE7_WUCBA